MTRVKYGLDDELTTFSLPRRISQRLVKGGWHGRPIYSQFGPMCCFRPNGCNKMRRQMRIFARNSARGSLSLVKCPVKVGGSRKFKIRSNIRFLGANEQQYKTAMKIKSGRKHSAS